MAELVDMPLPTKTKFKISVEEEIETCLMKKRIRLMKRSNN